MYTLLNNEHFWIYLSFIIFIIIFGKYIYKQFIKFLEEHVLLIKDLINNSRKPLDLSIQDLKKQKANLNSLNNRILKIKSKDKEISNMLIESFYENLSLKTQYIEESFKNYLKNENDKQVKKLSDILINSSYLLTLNILHKHLDENKKKEILNNSINKLDVIILNQKSTNVS